MKQFYERNFLINFFPVYATVIYTQFTHVYNFKSFINILIIRSLSDTLFVLATPYIWKKLMQVENCDKHIDLSKTILVVLSKINTKHHTHTCINSSTHVFLCFMCVTCLAFCYMLFCGVEKRHIKCVASLYTYSYTPHVYRNKMLLRPTCSVRHNLVPVQLTVYTPFCMCHTWIRFS